MDDKYQNSEEGTRSRGLYSPEFKQPFGDNNESADPQSAQGRGSEAGLQPTTLEENSLNNGQINNAPSDIPSEVGEQTAVAVSKASRKVIFFVVAGALLALVVVFVAIFSSSGSPPPGITEENSKHEAGAEGIKISVIDDLDVKYGDKSVVEEDLGFENKNPDKPILMANFDDDLYYFADEMPDIWRVYKMDNLFGYSKDIYTNMNVCDKFIANNEDKIVDINNIFKDSGYAYKKPDLYTDRSGMFEESTLRCHRGSLYVDSDYLCSSRFSAVKQTDNDDDTADVVFVASIACSSIDRLGDAVSLAKISRQINRDLEVDTTHLIYIPEYIKDSQTTGYKIAKRPEGGPNVNYYYKKGDYSWVQVPSLVISRAKGVVDLSCDAVRGSQDMLNAFKGEKCVNNNEETYTL